MIKIILNTNYHRYVRINILRINYKKYLFLYIPVHFIRRICNNFLKYKNINKTLNTDGRQFNLL